MTDLCPICDSDANTLDVVDLNKNCEERRGIQLPPSGTPIRFSRCGQCGFCFAPEMYEWTPEMFARFIYNDEYVLVDPDYVTSRPELSADSLMDMLGGGGKSIRHLDFGGGQGLMCDFLKDAGWNSTSFDPFVDIDVDLSSLGRFDLVTAFEVFEHVPNPKDLVGRLSDRMTDEGILLFTTLLSDDEIKQGKPLTWWYASPRNGHISLYTRASLGILAEEFRFKAHSFSSNLHAYWRGRPAWGEHLLPRES
jgi:SAM-dependent methyltransferase